MNAHWCPYCGARLQATEKQASASGSRVGRILYITLAVVFTALIAWGVVGLLATPTTTPKPKLATPTSRRTSSEGNEYMAWAMCQQFVETRLAAPSTAKFPSYTGKFTSSLGGGRFRFNAYVDAQNVFGAMVRNNFVCTIESLGGGDWQLLQLDFQP